MINQINIKVLLIFLAVIISNCTDYKKREAEKTIVKKIKSKYTGEKREIHIYIPEPDSLSKNSNFPVLFILDGETYFNAISSMIQLFQTGNEKGRLPKMAVIGIINTNRDRDFSPSKDLHPSASAPVTINDDEYKNTGGAKDFTLFIKNELIPYIESNYGLTGKKILIGHSFGGLLVTNTLLYYTETFNGYIAVDPSTWWNKKEMTKKAASILNYSIPRNLTFFYANSQFYTELSKSMKKGDPKDPHQNEIDFGNIFYSKKDKLSQFTWVHYHRESHESIPLIAIYDGLQTLNKHFKFKGSEQKISFLSDSYKSLYNQLDSVSINSKGYIKDSNSNSYSYHDSIHTSSNLFRIMGDLFLLQGDSTKALIYYNNSYNLNPKEVSIKQKMDKLKSRLSSY